MLLAPAPLKLTVLLATAIRAPPLGRSPPMLAVPAPTKFRRHWATPLLSAQAGEKDTLPATVSDPVPILTSPTRPPVGLLAVMFRLPALAVPEPEERSSVALPDAPARLTKPETFTAPPVPT